MTRAVQVGIVIGSDSDLDTMLEAVKVLDALGVGSEVFVASAHRTPHREAPGEETKPPLAPGCARSPRELATLVAFVAENRRRTDRVELQTATSKTNQARRHL